MKLTEKQLAEIFTNSTKLNQASGDVDECLNALPASSNRLIKAEGLINDYAAAQGMKMAIDLKQWSDIVAESVQKSQQPWFSFLGMDSPLKTAVATGALAVAFVVAMPEFKQDQTNLQPIQNNITNDVISNNHFENKADVLNKSDFDGGEKPNDSLFDGNFG
ncbi:hypothetical protein [Marinicella litoralis]|uniref:Uncharacterized protein n=1 Tax=Marinicella litoralis TaxID=644220 RepID=A0A4R6XZI5_9GAMM|nr:hypothetical protein [Marinicella litoralis]TDR23193.1 hypothetical protein C8D91_0052 [Marinicella litoralis]